MKDLALFVAAWIITAFFIAGIVYLLGSFASLSWDITAWTTEQGRAILAIGATAIGFLAALIAHTEGMF